ncbi:MAG: polysaccharide deacetylase family protein [Planctomycetales bacterium]|nr:polysaccharide deacetylase family protein [Planctomycetales bacterium]
MTHDDNRADHIEIAAPALSERGLVGTFNVNPGKWLTVPAQANYLEQYAAAAQAGHELSSHTMYHQGLRVNPDNPAYFDSVEEVEQDAIDVIANLDPLQYGGRPTVSIAYPYGQSAPETRVLISNYFLSGRKSAGPIVNPPSPPDMFQLGSANVGAGSADPSPWEDYNYSYDALTGYLDAAVTSGGWVIEEYHDIDLPGYGGVNLQAYYDHLDDLAEAVADGELWVATQGDVTRYILERDAAQIREDISPFAITITVEDNLDDSVFDVPLVRETEIPADWRYSIRATRDGAPMYCELTHGATTLEYEALANGCTIVISLTPADANLDGFVNGDDYLTWANNFHTYPTNGAAGGDFNHDGYVDGLDYLDWVANYGVTPLNLLSVTDGENGDDVNGQTNVGATESAGSVDMSQSVPEPAVHVLLVAGLISVGVERRRRRS